MKSVDVQVAVLSVQDGRLDALLVRLPGSVWALPGGPVGDREPLERAATGFLARQASLRGVELEQLYTFDRDGAEGASVAYLGLVPSERHPLAPGAEVVEVRWFPLGDLPALAPVAAEALAVARERLRAKAGYSPIVFRLLPETFTLAQLQRVYEVVLERSLDVRNFRRDILAADILRAVGDTRGRGPGRPARLYRAAPGTFEVLSRERRIARGVAAPGAPPEAPIG